MSNIKAILFHYQKNAEGKSPVYIRITKDRKKPKVYSNRYRCRFQNMEQKKSLCQCQVSKCNVYQQHDQAKGS